MDTTATATTVDTTTGHPTVPGKVKDDVKTFFSGLPHSVAVFAHDTIFLTLGTQGAGKSTLRQHIDNVVNDGKVPLVRVDYACNAEPLRLPGVGNAPSGERKMTRHMLNTSHERSGYVRAGRPFKYAIESIAAEAVDKEYDWLTKRFRRHPEYVPIFVINGASAGFFSSKLIFIALVRDLQLKGASLPNAVLGAVHLMWSNDLESVEAHPNHGHIRGLKERLFSDDVKTDDITAVVVDGIPGFSSEKNRQVAIALNHSIDGIIRIFVEREQAKIKKLVALRNTLPKSKRKRAIVVVTRRDLVEGISLNDTVITHGRTLLDTFDDIVHVMDPERTLIPESNKFSLGFIDWSWTPSLLNEAGELVKTDKIETDRIVRIAKLLFGFTAS